MKHSKLLLVVLVTLFVGPTFGKVSLPAIIGDNMVLQQDKKVRIWGWADPKERVNIAFGSQTVSTVADDKGHWETMIGPLKAGNPFEMTISGTNTLTIRNILVGEVWVCSGQSNMEWPLINARNGAETVAQANHPEIRLFTVQKATSDSPLDDVKGR
ncbi:MAG TPA: hypothetical protein VIK24_15550, partial [Pyrinomonadaceae bacterium]